MPRATFDVDILIDASPTNAQKLLDALLEAGFGTASLTSADEILANEITVFKDRVRIDVQTSTPGLDFQSAWPRRHGLPRPIVSCCGEGRFDLIASTLAAGGRVDLEDVRMFELPDTE